MDRSLSPAGLAAVLARLYAAAQRAGRSLWNGWSAAHRVDRGAPEEVGLHAAGKLVGPRAGWLSGYSFDESGVRHVEIEILGPSGATSTLTCDRVRFGHGRLVLPVGCDRRQRWRAAGK